MTTEFGRKNTLCSYTERDLTISAPLLASSVTLSEIINLSEFLGFHLQK
jgi:hypothetical protein